MNIHEKLTRIRPAIDAIATHEDEDAAVVKAGLQAVRAMCDEAEADLDARVAARIAEQTAP